MMMMIPNVIVVVDAADQNTRVSTATTTTKNEQQQDQVQNRIYEQIYNFMSEPTTAIQYWNDYYSLGGFDNKMNGADREQVAKYLYSMAKTSQYWMPFYGLEDGTFLGYLHDKYNTVPRLLYREPGNSGYDILDIDGYGSNNELNILYKNTCVESLNGSEEECVMDKSGGTYISCTNDCELIECNGAVTGDEINTKWCPNYSIETTTTSQQSELLGYIPRTQYCMNSQGLFSQEVGETLLETESGEVEIGDCTYGDGQTFVSRDNIFGPYEACGKQNENDGENAWCNQTFIGGHTSIDYDPRWRGWYMASKTSQHPRWSDPYIFFTFGVLGITYTHPIYLKDDQGREVFAGVLAADMLLDDISNFLVEAFQNSTFHVAIYEAAPPYQMIGLSSGSNIVQYVNSDDPSKSCSPDTSSQEKCTLVQTTIDKIDEGSIENDILRKSHFIMEKHEFGDDPEDGSIISVKERDDDVASTAHIPTIVKFEQPQSNLEWYILVTTPVERDSDDTILKGDTLFVIVCIIASLGASICLLLVSMFFCKRKERAVQLADFKFTSAFIFWCSLLNLSSLAFLGEITDTSCMTRMWTQCMLASLSISPLFVKTFRTWRLLGCTAAVSNTLNRAQMNNCQAWVRTLPIPLLQLGILLLFTYVDPPQAAETITIEGGTPIQSISCEHESDAYFITQGVYFAVLILAGCLLAYLTRNIDPRFADSKELLFAMYNILFSVLMVALITNIVTIPGSAMSVLITTAIFWITVFSSIVFVIPTLMAAKAERKQIEERFSKIRQTAQKGQNQRISALDDSGLTSESLHDTEDALKILICSGNIGNAEPTFDSMAAWIPIGGKCIDVTTLDGRPIEADQFDLVVIGMQESTWNTRKKKADHTGRTGKTADSMKSFEPLPVDLEVQAAGEIGRGSSHDTKTEAFMAAVDGEDTVALRKMESTILGEQYSLVKEEIRGQMRLHFWALESKVPFLEGIKVSGANTGIGNMLANKGGIIVSFEYQKTRFCFLTAHLAAHEGESYYQTRCNNVCDILRTSQTCKLSQKFDHALSSHHMFVFGDLNFRTKFGKNIGHEDSVNRALQLIEQKDFNALYRYDELHKGVKHGDLLMGFQTLRCRFMPTFKVERREGFFYKKQRTPSYTDRILFKTSPGLEDLVRPLAYEPCVDFITSDHKPIRGAFSVVTNEMVASLNAECMYRMVFHEMECSDLPPSDLNGLSDPYLMFVWDSVEMVEEKRRGFHLPRFFQRTTWPHTKYIPKTLNPSWKDQEIVLVSTSHEVSNEAMLYVSAYDYDFGYKPELLGTLALNIQRLLSTAEGRDQKTLTIDKPLQSCGKGAGRVKFKLEISKVIG